MVVGDEQNNSVFYERSQAFESDAVDEFLRYCGSQRELRQTIAFLIEQRERIRDEELERLEAESQKLFERLKQTSRRKLLEEVQSFKDILTLHKKLLQLNGEA
jgi:hypothetical protein